MTEKLEIPRYMLKGIREEAGRAAEKNREVVGLLLGEYNSKNNSIYVSEKERYTDIYPPSLAQRKKEKYGCDLEMEGKVPGFVEYWSHRDGSSWSDHEVELASSIPLLVNWPIAYLLYRGGDVNEFEALDVRPEPVSIPIEETLL